MEIVTGSTGRTHVTPIDDAVRNSHLALITERVVYSVPNYESFRAQAITANEVRVYSGYGSNQGRIFKIDESDFDSVTIENGSVNTKRMDLIVARYTMNQQTGYENISLTAIRGTSGTDYTEPAHETGNINSGAAIDDFVLYKVYINGIAIDHLEACFEPLPDGGLIGQVNELMEEINEKLDLIPFDLDEAVNKTYVDNKVSTMEQTLRTNFQNGVDTIKNRLINTHGITPTASTPSAIASAVGNALTNIYSRIAQLTPTLSSAVGDADITDPTVSQILSAVNSLYQKTICKARTKTITYGVRQTGTNGKAILSVPVVTDNLRRIRYKTKSVSGTCVARCDIMYEDSNGDTQTASWNILNASTNAVYTMPASNDNIVSVDVYMETTSTLSVTIELLYDLY